MTVLRRFLDSCLNIKTVQNHPGLIGAFVLQAYNIRERNPILTEPEDPNMNQKDKKLLKKGYDLLTEYLGEEKAMLFLSLFRSSDMDAL